MNRILAALSLSVCVFLNAEELVLKNHGKLVQSLTVEQLEKLSESKEISVLEPHESIPVTYKAIPITPLLDSVYGNQWKKTEEILFTCLDGYQPSIPVERFKKYTAYLAFQRIGSKKFAIENKLQNENEVQLGPFYLIWDNTKNPELKKERASGWPYQVTALDLIQFSDQFPKMSPPENSPKLVQRGFLAFRKYCMTCHTLNGEGGTKGVELNYPSSVTEYFKEAWLRKWITDPQSVRFGTTMPAFQKMDTQWKQDLEGILSYLKAMAANKKKPAPK